MNDQQDIPGSGLDELREALDSGALLPVQRLLSTLHPAEIGHLLESLPPAQRTIVWDLVAYDDGGETLVHVNDAVRSQLIAGMGDDALVAAADGMEVDDLADLLVDLPEAITQRILLSMDRQHRERLEAVLAFEEDTAGGLMNTDTITVRPDVTVSVVLRYLRRHQNGQQRRDGADAQRERQNGKSHSQHAPRAQPVDVAGKEKGAARRAQTERRRGDHDALNRRAKRARYFWRDGRKNKRIAADHRHAAGEQKDCWRNARVQRKRQVAIDRCLIELRHMRIMSEPN